MAMRIETNKQKRKKRADSLPLKYIPQYTITTMNYTNTMTVIE